MRLHPSLAPLLTRSRSVHLSPTASPNQNDQYARQIAAQIFAGGGHLYGFAEADFARADAAARPTAR